MFIVGFLFFIFLQFYMTLRDNLDYLDEKHTVSLLILNLLLYDCPASLCFMSQMNEQLVCVVLRIFKYLFS